MAKKIVSLLSVAALFAMFASTPIAMAVQEVLASHASMDMGSDCHSRSSGPAAPSSGDIGASACCGTVCNGYTVGPVNVVPVFFVIMIMLALYRLSIPTRQTIQFYRPPKN